MKTLCVSVAVCAHNEAATIERLLKQLSQQKEQNFVVTEIVVVADGCTDATAAIVSGFSDSRVRLIEDGERKGKSARLNEIFRSTVGEILVLFDADVLLIDDQFIVEMVKPFIENSLLGLAGGNALPQKGETFVQRAVNCSIYAYIHMSMRIAEIGLQYHFVKQAHVFYSTVRTLADHIKQNKRYVSSGIRMRRVFGDIADREFSMPKYIVYQELFVSFVRSPIYAISILCFNLYARYIAYRQERTLVGAWEISHSTKK